MIVASSLDAAELPPSIVSASYSGGACQLRVNSVSQKPSSQNRRGFIVAMDLQLEIPAATAPGGFRPLPADVYLDNEATPLTSASVVPGKNLAKTPHLWSVEAKDGRVSITDLEIGEARLRLQSVDVELVLTTVTEWETRTFQAKSDRSDFFQCGPFELRTYGDPQRFRVDVWAYPQFREDHERFRQRMPVTFLNHLYGIQQLRVVDAANRSPTSMGTSTPSSGAASCTFSGWSAPETGTSTAPSVTGDDIVYPVSIEVKLPKRFEKERVKFHFNAIPLPEPTPKLR